MTAPTLETIDRVDWLESRLRPDLGERVSSAPAVRALYTSDASNYRRVPRIVATPTSADELAAIVGLATEAGVPITMRGAGTSIAGNALGSGILVVTTAMDRILDLDPDERRATVEPGVILGELNRRAAAHGLRVGPDPSTHSRCTIGGMVGNNACGAHSVAWGTTAENTLGLDVIRANGDRLRLVSPAAGHGATLQSRDTAWPSLGGELHARVQALLDADEARIRAELPRWPRRVSGYSLDWLLPERGVDVARALVGTEGTCAVVAGATIALVKPPAHKVLLILGFADDFEGADAVMPLLNLSPFTIESMSSELLALAGVSRDATGLPDGGAWLMVEAGGDTLAEARDHAERLAASIDRAVSSRSVRLIEDARAQLALWRIREDGAGYAARTLDGGPAWPGFEDSAVPPHNLGRYLRELRALLRGPGTGGRHLRPLWRGLHPPAGRLRAGPAGRHGALRAIHERGGGPGGAPRRDDVGRARRRPGAQRAAGADVQPGDDRPVRAVQGALGPGRGAQSGHHRPAARGDRGPARRCGR